ncbi:MAG: hypothetical protein WD737_02505 [Gemmatimonadota bacterium]
MYLLLLTLTLLSGLALARRAVEPTCPACSGKRWKAHPSRLECGNCGWTNLATAPADSSGPDQYEILLLADR